MAVDFFLEIDGIKGESGDEKHKDQLDIESWAWGVSQQGIHATGGGGGAGKASFQDLHFTAHASKASPELMIACATGKHIPKSVLHVRKAGGDQKEYYTVTLTDVLVSSFQAGAHTGGDARPTDQFALNFAKVEFEYKPQKADGSLGGSVKAGYDVKANKKL